MRRVVSVCLGALACLFVIGLSHAAAEDDAPTTTIATTTTTPAVTVGPTTTAKAATTTTTAKGTATTTTLANGGRPIPPPAAGPSQTLVPDLLGTPVELETSTTSSTSTPPFGSLNPGTLPTNITAPISTNSDSPSGLTLMLAAVAWLASFGGLLVYAEDKRAANWKHLAR